MFDGSLDYILRDAPFPVENPVDETFSKLPQEVLNDIARQQPTFSQRLFRLMYNLRPSGGTLKPGDYGYIASPTEQKIARYLLKQ